MKKAFSVSHCLDASGLYCPQPLALTKQHLNKLQGGDILKVITTDPSSVIDFKVFTALTGNELIQVKQHAIKYEFWIRKKMVQ